MKVFTCNTWSSLASFATDPGRFVGLAIGPESHESVVRVGDFLLHAGRALALASSGGAYTVTRHIRPKTAVTAISRLQLVAFECLEEMAVELARPPSTHSASSALTAAGGWQRLITVPFVGRRHARVQLVCAAATVDYRIYGIAYNAGSRDERETLLEEVTAATPDADSTVAFHVGGTNEEEPWDAIAIDLQIPTDQTCSIDVLAIGELGVG